VAGQPIVGAEMVAPCLAVVGLAARFGGASRAELERALYRGAPLPAPAAAPAGLAGALADEAIADAGLPDGEPVACLYLDLVDDCLGDAAAALATPGLGAVVLVAADRRGQGGALVLRRPDPLGPRPYAYLRAAPPNPDHAETLAAPHGQAPAHVTREHETSGGRPGRRDGPQRRAAEPADAVPALVDTDAPAVAEIATLVAATLAVHGRYLPGRDGGPARPWFVAPGAYRRVRPAGSPLVVEEAAPSRCRPQFAPTSSLDLIPLAADDPETLLADLDTLAAALDREDPAAVARRARAAGSARGQARLGVALVGDGRDELALEIAAARAALPAAAASGREWQTPRGSSFAGSPLGRDAGIAFVYPGAFAAYVGAGRDAWRLFPNLHDRCAALQPDLGGALAAHLLYPRQSAQPSPAELSAGEARLAGEAASVVEAGIALAVLYTMIARDQLGVRPCAAFGYSLGESTMLWALGVWRDAPAASLALRRSPLFHSRVAGPKEAIREHWRDHGLPTPDDLWAAYVVLASAGEVEAALADEPQAYLTMINAPREVVVAGEPRACARVVARLGAEHLRTPFAPTLHAPPISSEAAAFAAINARPVAPAPGVTFYSAAEYAPLALDPIRLPDQLARMAVERFDFARLVERVYADGARVFVELGPGNTCTRLVEANLRGRPHLAVSLDRRGADAQRALFGMAARLHGHRVALDLARLDA
jgi:PfaB family protein